MVGEAALLVALHAGEPVALPREAAEAGFAVGCEVLAADRRAGAIEHGRTAAELVLDRRRGIAGCGGADAHERDPLLVIHDVDVVVLAAGPAMVLEDAVDVVRGLDGAALLAHELLHALAGVVIEVLRVDRGLGADGLRAERLQLAGMVPLELARCRLADRVAVSVHGIRDRGRADVERFGAPGDDVVALGQYIAAPVRFVFPEAPIELGGLYGDSRAWWRLDLARLEEDLRTGKIHDRRAEVPEGLDAVRGQMMQFLDDVHERFALDTKQLALGGFSQGAMLALDIALHHEIPPAVLDGVGTLLAATGSTRIPGT